MKMYILNCPGIFIHIKMLIRSEPWGFVSKAILPFHTHLEGGEVYVSSMRIAVPKPVGAIDPLVSMGLTLLVASMLHGYLC